MWLQSADDEVQPFSWHLLHLQLSSGKWTRVDVPFSEDIATRCWHETSLFNGRQMEYPRELLYVDEADGQLMVHLRTESYCNQTPRRSSRWRSYRWRFE